MIGQWSLHWGGTSDIVGAHSSNEYIRMHVSEVYERAADMDST